MEQRPTTPSANQPLRRVISRRFSTLTGFREIGDFHITGTNVRVLSIREQFDPERYEDDRTTYTLPSRSEFGSIRILNDGRSEWEVSTYATTIATSVKSQEPPYHVFDHKKQWAVVSLVGVAGLFSGLSANIFFPALETISKDLKVSLSAVSLTITSYLVVQGISPLFWGTLSDTVGRRQIYIYSFLVYIAANVALSFSPNYAVLLIFRGLQAAGSASTVSIGNGVIQDIVAPAERGGFIGFYQAIRNLGVAVGPVLGGLFSHFFGFRSIFIFLFVLSSLTFIAIVIFLPETLRSIAGNGSVRLRGIHQPLVRHIREPLYLAEAEVDREKPKITARMFLESLLLLKEKDILISLVFGGVIYAVWSMVTSSTTGLFTDTFHLGDILLGLSFLPNGLGTIIGSTIVGNLMNKNYQEAEEAYRQKHSLPPKYTLPRKSLPTDFPIEHARMRHIVWITALFVVTTALYGFSLASPALTSRPGWIAVPLVLQFFIAATSNAVFAINQTMVSDLCPGKGASSTAINNLVRCSMGAVGTALVEEMIAAMGVGGAFLGLALITLTVAPLCTMQWYSGAKWRKQRSEKRVDKIVNAERVNR